MEKTAYPMIGEITSTAGGMITVSSDEEFRDIPAVRPYGYHACPPLGHRVLVVQTPHGPAVMGALFTPEGIEPGEIRLVSAGGATLVLKNDGRVVINGQDY